MPRALLNSPATYPTTITDVIVQELVFATREAHVLDAVTPFGRAMFWVVFNLFVVAMLCVDFMCADSKSSGASRAKFRGAALWTYVTVVV